MEAGVGAKPSLAATPRTAEGAGRAAEGPWVWRLENWGCDGAGETLVPGTELGDGTHLSSRAQGELHHKHGPWTSASLRPRG